MLFEIMWIPLQGKRFKKQFVWSHFFKLKIPIKNDTDKYRDAKIFTILVESRGETAKKCCSVTVFSNSKSGRAFSKMLAWFYLKFVTE